MIVIVGAGPAGLSAAYHLASDFVIFEKHSVPGGLCKSFNLAGATFDLGGHAFFTRHEYVRQLLTRLSESGLFIQQRRAWVYSHGRYIRYPFQMHLHGLPVNVIKDCLVGLYHGIANGSETPVGNLQEWINRSFGDGISKHFLTPYNQKLWAFPLDEMSPDWTSDRIVMPDIEAIVAGALEDVEFTRFENAEVSYPSQGGFFNLYKGLLPSSRNHLQQSRIVHINPKQRYAVTDGTEIVPFEYLISTMPLTDLVATVEGMPMCCRDAAALLQHNSLYLVNLVFERPNISDMQRVYVANDSIPFHRLVLNSNSSASLRSQMCFGIQAEVSFSPHKAVARRGLEQRVLKSLVRMGIIEEGERPIATAVTTIEHAYPIYTKDTPPVREHLLTELEKMGIFCAGRFGEWLYINSDDAVMRGMARAETVNSLSATGAPPLTDSW